MFAQLDFQMCDDENDTRLGKEFGLAPSADWPPAKSRPVSASQPFPRMPADWCASPSTKASLERAGRQAVDFFKNYAGNGAKMPVSFPADIDRIVRDYWADQRYDDQLSSLDIRNFLQTVHGNIIRLLHNTRRYPPFLRADLNSQLKASTRDGPLCLGLDDFDKLLQDFSVVIERYVADEKPEKVEATAVSKCCDALLALWEGAAGSRRHASKFVEQVCIAVDPALTSKQVSWRLKKSRQAQKQKK